jgi:hypothetical protein
MMEKNERAKQEKKDALESNVNKLVKNFDVQEKGSGAAAKPSDKVPEHALLVNDNETLSKELMDLKRRLKEINLENIKIQSNIKLVESKKRQKEA